MKNFDLQKAIKQTAKETIMNKIKPFMSEIESQNGELKIEFTEKSKASVILNNVTDELKEKVFNALR
ncbi:hypothetical protein KO506_12805 [Polaribacter vadi]|uniref:hypothetical protein n=1 Tax=Polaribacter TaxID=52959 RepID=UPI001C08A65F|nr:MULTISPECIES: hypothetical protein [Polaribacter]MBU3012288.1 hypothetical protein [Polaribacter vadi]MDO6742105.1 hypothetical protein [Polaribacter sp. 1_MG-2023]